MQIVLDLSNFDSYSQYEFLGGPYDGKVWNGVHFLESPPAEIAMKLENGGAVNYRLRNIYDLDDPDVPTA